METYAAKVAGTAAAREGTRLPIWRLPMRRIWCAACQGLTDCIASVHGNLEHLMAQLQTTEDVHPACRIRDEILPAMSALRAAADEAETITCL